MVICTIRNGIGVRCIFGQQQQLYIFSVLGGDHDRYNQGRIRHHGRLVALPGALEPVNDHCFIVSNCLSLLQRTSVASATVSYWCRKVS